MTATIEFFSQIPDILKLNSDNPQLLEQFDDRRFRFGLYLINQDSRAVKIRKGAIQELVIVDDLLDWFHHGHIIFDNPDDVLERVNSQLTTDNPSSQKVPILPYRFRGDARDMIYMVMEPHVASDDETNFEVDSIVHTMEFLFTVYAIEDIDTGEGKKGKRQKLHFHDYRMQMLREKNIYYSTAKHIEHTGDNVKTQTNITQKNNKDRSKTTGEIVQDILSASLQDSDVKGLFSRHWDFGDKKLFYTSPSENKALDDLNYVLDRHVSTSNYTNQPSILKLQRTTNRWELLPVTEYFKRSVTNKGPGPYQSEFFTLSFDSEADPTEIPPPAKTFGSTGNVHTNYHFSDISIIDDYVFSEINGVDCQELLNSVIVHRYDEGTKQFDIDVTSGNIENVKTNFQQLFINNTLGGNDGHGYTSWLSDTTRAENLNITVTSSTYTDKTGSMYAGRNKTLLAAFLLGNTIQFKSRGLTARRSGVWIAIDRPNNYVDSEYEGKVLGQYFVTRVTHTITPQGYENNILGVKPYLYESPGFDTDDIFRTNPEKLVY